MPRIVIKPVNIRILKRFTASNALKSTLTSTDTTSQPTPEECDRKRRQFFTQLTPAERSLLKQQPETRRSSISAESISHAFHVYAKLSKLRLATLVVLTTMAGYSISPSTCFVSSPTLLLATSLGTSLCITSANTINQLMEIQHDSKMTRTKNRLLPSGEISPRIASYIAGVSALAGTGILWWGVNGMTAALGFGNILLYTCGYTPMKRYSVWNTHLGALVGAIPPLMGWTAINGGHIIGDSFGGLFFAGILFAWQFPHFNALSHGIRSEYIKGGYKMMANINPDLNTLVSLRWSLALVPLCFGLTASGITTPAFLLTSLIPNGYLLNHAFKFYRSKEGQERDKAAKGLFMASLFHLPAIVILMLLHKKHWHKDMVGKKYLEAQAQTQ